MANKILISVFDDEATAYRGLTALKDLHSDGDITLYATIVLVKDRDGRVTAEQQEDSGPIGTATGALAGSLIGILGGPVGMLVGASVGGLTGLYYDAYSAGVDVEFLDDITAALLPGKVAVVTEVDETWTAPVDTRIHELGGLVFRRFKSEVAEDQIARESAALDADLLALEEELATASAEHKASVEKNIAAVKAQLQTLHTQAKLRLEKAKADGEERLNALQEQAKTSTGQAKARIERRIATAKSALDVRVQKLKQVFE